MGRGWTKSWTSHAAKHRLCSRRLSPPEDSLMYFWFYFLMQLPWEQSSHTSTLFFAAHGRSDSCIRYLLIHIIHLHSVQSNGGAPHIWILSMDTLDDPGYCVYDRFFRMAMVIILNLRSSFPAFIQRVKDGHAGVPQLPDFLMHKLQPFILL